MENKFVLTKEQKDSLRERKQKVIEGIDLLLTIFETAGQTLFPRKIMTGNYPGTFVIGNKEEMIKAFEQADFVDCRVNAYPVVPKDALQIPNIIIIDLDVDKQIKSGFYIIKQTLKEVEQKIAELSNNTIDYLILWTGNGYHVYVILKMLQPLENITEYALLGIEKISREFMLFAKGYLSDNKADSKNNPSFESCLLRVPFTLNSKCVNEGKSVEAEVKVINTYTYQKCSRIGLLLSSFYTHLVSERIDKDKKEQATKLVKTSFTNNSSIYWIDLLLDEGLSDHRKYVIRYVLPQYFINIKRLSEEESITKIKEWLFKCNSKRPLDKVINYDHYIKYYITQCMNNRNLKPISFENKIKEGNPDLYRIIKSKLK